MTTEPVTKWSEGPLLPTSSISRSTGGHSNSVVIANGSAATNLSATNISIFVDPDLSNTENELTKSNQKPPKRQGNS